MEEDISYLIASVSILRDMNIQFTEKSRNKLADRIANLIKRYKELEETYEHIKFIRGRLPKDTLMIAMCNEDFCRNFGNDFILKFKIKNIYDKLNNDIDYFSKDLRKDLRELLEDFEETGNHIPRID